MNIARSAAVSAALFLLAPLAQAADPVASNISCGVTANSVSGVAAAPGETLPNTATTPIAWADLGAKATAQYSGDGLAIAATPAGTVALRCAFQKLEGELTRDGLWLSSTATDAPASRFRLMADSIGRAAAAMVALPSIGDTQCTGQQARFTRPGLTEEYSVSADGVRQDFVVAAAPAGVGELRVELALTGARASSAADGAQLVLDGSGRKLAYSRLRVVDATGKELTARMEVSAAHRLAVLVADAAAVYPLRIDPTFSDANWISMGVLPGADGTINAAVVDGSGNLYVGGSFSSAGGTPTIAHIAKWDGSAWSALGEGMDSEVYALAVSGTTVYAGGNYIAKWDGTTSTWSALKGGVEGKVYALAVASDGTLYAGGLFIKADDVRANYIAKWNGSDWSALGTGMNDHVTTLAVSGTTLYAGGSFTTAGGGGANHIAQWDGSAWSALGTGMNNNVTALAVSGTTLYAGGWFTMAGEVDANYIAKWDGSPQAWSALGEGMSSEVYALAVVSDGTLYAGGSFNGAGGESANRIAQWDGSAWSALGTGMNDTVYALTEASDGTLYAGGDFTWAGDDMRANHIAKWNGSPKVWSGVGEGLDNQVYAMAVSGTTVYAGGSFYKAGAVSANYIAKWDGSAWSALGTGMNNIVWALAVASNGTLYAGGNFTTAGGLPANRIAQWDGSAWSAVGTGIDSTVFALAVSGTTLYAGGYFYNAGGVSANCIAKWDGKDWSALGTGMGGDICGLCPGGGVGRHSLRRRFLHHSGWVACQLHCEMGRQSPSLVRPRDGDG